MWWKCLIYRFYWLCTFWTSAIGLWANNNTCWRNLQKNRQELEFIHCFCSARTTITWPSYTLDISLSCQIRMRSTAVACYPGTGSASAVPNYFHVNRVEEVNANYSISEPDRRDGYIAGSQFWYYVYRIFLYSDDFLCYMAHNRSGQASGINFMRLSLPSSQRSRPRSIWLISITRPDSHQKSWLEM